MDPDTVSISTTAERSFPHSATTTIEQASEAYIDSEHRN